MEESINVIPETPDEDGDEILSLKKTGEVFGKTADIRICQEKISSRVNNIKDIGTEQVVAVFPLPLSNDSDFLPSSLSSISAVPAGRRKLSLARRRSNIF